MELLVVKIIGSIAVGVIGIVVLANVLSSLVSSMFNNK